MLLGETCSFGYVVEGSDITPAPFGGAWYPHNSRMNMTMLDGHVEDRHSSQMTSTWSILFGGGGI